MIRRSRAGIFTVFIVVVVVVVEEVRGSGGAKTEEEAWVTSAPFRML